MAEPLVRTLREDERADASRVVNYGMLGSVADDASEAWADLIDADRCHGAFDRDSALVGLARYFPTRVTVPGGDLPAAGVTAVAVLSNHRRQGHLTRLMHAELAAIAAEEIPIALLVAAEWPIYGRFGYGPSIDAANIEIDPISARFRQPATGAVELVLPAELRSHLEAAHEARRVRTPGAIQRDAHFWDRVAGVRGWPGHKFDPGQMRGAIWRDGAGDVAGAVAYKVKERWERKRPAGEAEVSLLVGATPEAERELWRHLCEVDWVRKIKAENRGVDDPLPLFLRDGRAPSKVLVGDCIWARLLDLPAAFSQRRAERAGQTVVEVVDEMGYASGRWSLELGPDESAATPTSEAVDVTLPVGSLGAMFFGGYSARRLHEAGWLEEEAPGGLDRLDSLLATSTAPWSPTTY